MNRLVHRLVRLTALGVTLASTAVMAQTSVQSFPQKQVTFIVPYSAGGGTDNVARKFAQALEALWKQPVVVENLPGASSFIGAQKVAAAAPDGYTLMVTTNGTITGNRFLFKKEPYDPDKAFMPISQLSDISMVVLANADFPANNLKELVALAKKEPGKITYSSYGKGSQPELLFGLFAKRENLQLLQVPYKGVAPAITSVMAGETNMTLTGRGSAAGAIASGKTKILVYLSDKRDPALPNVPSSDESGYPYMKIPTWHALFAPAGTPPALVDKIQKDVAKVASNPEFLAQMAKLGYEVPANTPAQFTEVLRKEIKLMGEMAESAGLKPE